MTLMMEQPETSDALLAVSASLNRFVNEYDLTPERDTTVYCFDTTEAGWRDLPAAWHRPSTGDIVLNMGTILQSLRDREPWFGPDSLIPSPHGVDAHPQLLTEVVRALEIPAEERKAGRRYRTFQEDGTFNPRQVTRTHGHLAKKLAVKTPEGPVDSVRDTVLAVLLHETGHAVFSQFRLEPWYAELDGYQAQILAIFEELRCERQQLQRIGAGTALIRRAADVVVDPTTVAEDVTRQRDADGKVNVPNVALNSTLILGRVGYKVFLEHEVARLNGIVLDAVGDDRHTEMHRIWHDYSNIRELDGDAMVSCIDRWVELFPSDGSSVASRVARVVPTPGSGSFDSGTAAGSSAADPGGPGEQGENLDLPGLADEFGEAVEHASDRAVEFPTATSHENAPDECAPSGTSFASAESMTAAMESAWKVCDPTVEDRQLAQHLAQDLLQLNVSERHRVVRNSLVPPGRLRGRALVQRAADRAAGRISAAEPFRQVRRSVQVNPPVTVGVLTDTSSSQGWSTVFSSRIAWIISRAVSDIHGRTAAVTFGETVQITIRPGERPDKRVEVKAIGKTELFDTGMGTLDAMLELREGVGTRIVFVVTDGELVKDYDLEMKKAADWVRDLTDAGCLIVWISPDPTRTFGSYPTTPVGAVPLAVDVDEAKEDPSSVVYRLIDTLREALALRGGW